MKVLFVAEQFLPPIDDGSTAVYQAWLKTLRTVGEVYPIFFTMRGAPGVETHAYLQATYPDYLILPAHAPSPLLKTIRACGRFANGSLFTQRWIEEFGRGQIQQTISKFLAAHQPDVALISKLECVHLLGQEILTGLRIPKLVDLHDDFVTRGDLERQALRELFQTLPGARNYQHYRRLQVRHALARLDYARARRQEARLLGLFDRILISSWGEYADYSARPELQGRCVHLPWPIAVAAPLQARSETPVYDAGIIAGASVFNMEGLAFFVREVLPRLRRQRPAFRLLLAGEIVDPFRASGLPRENVECVRRVGDVAEFYRRLKVCLVPLQHGTGVSLKTLEGLSYGLPVVATTMGARGLARRDLPNLFLADRPESFAQTVLMLLESQLAEASGGAPFVSLPPEEHRQQFLRLCQELGVAQLPPETNQQPVLTKRMASSAGTQAKAKIYGD